VPKENVAMRELSLGEWGIKPNTGKRGIRLGDSNVFQKQKVKKDQKKRERGTNSASQQNKEQ